jgi:hypothetical protein
MPKNAGLLTQHVSGTSMPIIRNTMVNSAFWCSNMESRLGCIAAQHYTTQTAFQVRTPKRGIHYCIPDDGHTGARNMLSQ